MRISLDISRSHPRRRAACALLAACGLLAGASALAQPGFPAKSVHVIVPFPPGGINDNVARPLLQKMGEILKTSFVVENRPGASGTIGTAAAARAPADGYTLLLGAASTMAVVPAMMQNVPYQSLQDFVPIGGIASVPSVLISGKRAQYPDFAAVQAAAKAKPGALTFGSAGAGTSHHVQMEFLNLDTGLSMLHVPYKGSGPAMGDLLGGQIDLMMDPLPTALPQAQSGKVVPLAISSAKRSPLMPEVPTFVELGVKDFVVSTWFGLFAPAGTPEAARKVLTDALATALRDPATSAAMAARGQDPMPMTPAELGAHVQAETTLWKDVVDKTKISLN
jgi:tripartite-type tricarboxylate transporter receptor subunit TctC